MQDTHFDGANKAREFFLTETYDFEIDYSREHLLFTAFPSGFLKRKSRLSATDLELQVSDAKQIALFETQTEKASRMDVEVREIPAFIISLNYTSTTFETARYAAISLGCRAHYIKATTVVSFQHREAMIKDTFGLGSSSLQLFAMSGAEIALVNSHKRVLQQIANWPSLEDDDWALVLEEDATLLPDLQLFSDEERKELLTSTIKRLKRYGHSGILYLGACSPQCDDKNEDALLAY